MASDLSGLRERPLKQSQECRVDRHDSRWEMEVPAVVLFKTDIELSVIGVLLMRNAEVRNYLTDG